MKRLLVGVLFSLIILGLWIIANRNWLNECECGTICSKGYYCQLQECHKGGQK